MDDALVLQLLQRCVALIDNAYISVRVLDVILIERLLTQCQQSGFHFKP